MANRKWLASVWTDELPEISARWHTLAGAFFFFFSIGYALTVVPDAFVHDTIMLGPGLVDEPLSLTTLALDMAEGLIAQGYGIWLWGIIPLGVLAMLFNAVLVYRGYSWFERELGQPYSLRELCTFFLLNGTLVALMYIMLVMCGLLALSLGYQFPDGFDIIRHITLYSQSIVANVPTLVELPYPLPLIASMIVIDFFYYWFHRLGHTWRPFWLLWHRPHHMMPHLTIPATQPVFAAVPLFILVALPFQIITGTLAKVFGPDTMILEAILLRIIGQFPAIYSHNSALYQAFHKNRLMYFLGSFFGAGNFHYMHHSALREHSLCNIGGALFFFWDRVFGTYFKPLPEKPPVGLTGSPELYMNPVRLALSGMLQIVYEWRNNPGWKDRWLILFGSSNYVPPITKDFAIKRKNGAGAATSAEETPVHRPMVPANQP